MDRRVSLQNLFETLLGSRSVYFDPPASVEMKYPAIVYTLKDLKSTPANNSLYRLDTAYDVTFISTKPSDKVVREILKSFQSRFNNQYIANNLYHYSITIYY